MRLTIPLSLLVVGTSALAVGFALLQSTKLNAPQVVTTTLGDVEEFQLSPDGVWVVYRADQDVAGVEELYAVRRDGTNAQVRLNDDLVAGGEILQFGITPDSTRVVYLAEQDTIGKVEIYSAPLTGGGSTKLNGSLAGEVRDTGLPFLVTADGQTVLFRTGGLYAVPADGSLAPLLLTPAGWGAEGDDYALTPDQQTVVFHGTHLGYPLELFKVPLDASASPVRLNDTITPGGHVIDFAISPDGNRVVYVADQITVGEDEIFSVPLDLSATAVKLNSLVKPITEFEIDSTSQYVVYRHKLETNGEPAEAYSAPIDGSSGAVRLNDPIPFGFVSFLITPDGSEVVYVLRNASVLSSSYSPAYSVPIDGSSAPTPLTSADTRVGDFEITPDSTRLVFTGQVPSGGASAYQLYVVPLDASADPMRLNDPLWEDVDSFELSADSSTVVYLAGPSVGNSTELASVPLDGSSAPLSLIVPAAPPWTDIEEDVALDSVSGTAVFRGDTTQAGVRQVSAVPIDASALPEILNAPLIPAQVPGEVNGFATSPDGKWVVYSDSTGFWGKEILEGGPAVLLSPAGLEQVFTPQTEILFTSDSKHVFFTFNIDTVQVLYRAAVDGSAEGTVLHTRQRHRWDSFHSLQLTPDESTLFHALRLYDSENPIGELFTVPADGSGPPETLAEGCGVDWPQLTRDGEDVIFTVDSYDDRQIHTVPMDGGSPDTAFFSWPLTAWATQGPDLAGDRVVYVTSDVDNARDEMWSVPQDASAPPTRLSGGMRRGFGFSAKYQISPDPEYLAWVRRSGNNYLLNYGRVDGTGTTTLLASYPIATVRVDSLVFSPDGSRLVFLADAVTNGKFELFSVPVDGSQAPVKVNQPFVPAGDATVYYAVTPDGTRVVYLCDGRVNNRNELFAAPIEGGGPAVMLHDPLTANQVIEREHFLLTKDSKRVLYRMSPDAFWLPVWSARLDGAGDPILRCGPWPLSVDVGVERDFEVTENGMHVVYRANEDDQNTIELYSFPLKPRPRKAPPLR